MSDETVAGRGTSLFGRSMSCGDEGDELAILPIAVFDLVQGGLVFKNLTPQHLASSGA